MKKSATQFALYLHLHPEKGLEQWQLMRTLPDGMSELLQTAASGKKRLEVAASLGMEVNELQAALIKFLQLVILNNQDSPYRGLAARERASLDTCTHHKKLLQNIFHPDKFQDDKAHDLIQKIQQSYTQVSELNSTKESNPAVKHFTANIPVEDNQEDDHVMRFQVNNSPRPRSPHRHYEQKKQTTFVLAAGIAGLVLASLLVILMVPSNPNEVVRQAVISEPAATPEKRIILAGSTQSTLKPTSDTQYPSIGTQENAKIQLLLNEFERGLEGDLIEQLVDSKSPSQSSKQMMDLFASADHKKVFFHGFAWNQVQNGYYGEGEFLVRLQFSQNNQWVTRKGKSTITLSDNGQNLFIKQFHFEDNLH